MRIRHHALCMRCGRGMRLEIRRAESGERREERGERREERAGRLLTPSRIAWHFLALLEMMANHEHGSDSNLCEGPRMMISHLCSANLAERFVP
jgi:hypothetical protein